MTDATMTRYAIVTVSDDPTESAIQIAVQRRWDRIDGCTCLAGVEWLGHPVNPRDEYDDVERVVVIHHPDCKISPE